MKAKVEFDLENESDRYAYAAYLVMERNARFWDDLYDEVFRPKIKYGNEAEYRKFSEVWEQVTKFRYELDDE